MTNCQKQAILRPIVPVAQTRSFTAANADNVDSDHVHKIAGLLVDIRHNIFYGSEITNLLLIDTRCFKKKFFACFLLKTIFRPLWKSKLELSPVWPVGGLFYLDFWPAWC